MHRDDALRHRLSDQGRPLRSPVRCTRKRTSYLLLLPVLVWLLLALFLAPPLTAAEPETAPADAAAVNDEPIEWLTSLAQGYMAAQSRRAPLIVRAGADWCAFCRDQEQVLAAEEMQAELRRWIPVAIDVDVDSQDAEALAVGPIPAFRLLTPAGQLIASHDGLLDAPELVEWLQSHFDAAAVVITDELLAEGPPDADAVESLIEQFQHRDAVVREAAVRRLTPYPDVAAHQVANMLPDATLAARLTALDVLAAWRAPIDGLDPWLPDSITEDRLRALVVWARDVDPAAAAAAEAERPLTADELADFERTLRLLVSADRAEAAALREHLARYGRRALPVVYAALAQQESDDAKMRLTAVRYRLVAAPALVLRWPGGLERLADVELATRVAAADELAAQATAADEPLLLELFSDPAPLVREISLRALQQVGGSGAGGMLVKLLDDPDPNVRAAVLQQLAEKPAQSVVPAVAQYVAKETDADLVVHAVRLLREASGAAALETLKSLFEHASWRVRAEAAEAVGKAVTRQYDDADKANSYISLIGLLDDEDSFVVSRAVEALIGADLVTAVEPLVAAADKHPDIAPNVVLALSQGTQQRTKAVPHIRRFCTHPSPAVRAAAITGLCQAVANGAATEFAAATTDADPTVRIAAADALFTIVKGALTPKLHNGDTSVFPSSGRTRVVGDPDSNPEATAESDADRAVEIEDTTAAKATATVINGPTAPPLSESAFRRRLAMDATSTAEAPEAPAPAGELALLEYRRGETSPKWHAEFAAGLQPMLSAERADERVAAARPLAILADERALAILQAASVESAHQPRVADVLPYLLWEDRADLFGRIVGAARSDESLTRAANSFAETPEDRAAPPLWDLVARDGMHARLVDSLLHSLLTAYLGSYYARSEDLNDSVRDRTLDEAAEVLSSGSRWQRTAALVLQHRVDPNAAAESARLIWDDTAVDPGLRADAFAILLVAGESELMVPTAVEGLSSADPQLRRISLAALTAGADSITALPSGVSFNSDRYSHYFSSREQDAGLPEPPAGLSVDAVRPLLAAGDPAAVAQAGYLLVLLGEPDGYAPLVDYWQRAGQTDAALTRLVYRAIALQDDSTRLSTLEDIYTRMRADVGEGDVRDFYWSIRGMRDRRAAALRKRIRDEVGMDSLR